MILKTQKEKDKFLKECLAEIRRIKGPFYIVDGVPIKGQKRPENVSLQVNPNIIREINQDMTEEQLEAYKKLEFLVALYNEVSGALLVKVLSGDSDEEFDLDPIFKKLKIEKYSNEAKDLNKTMAVHRSKSLKNPLNKFYAFIAKYFPPKSKRFLEKYQFFKDNLVASYTDKSRDSKVLLHAVQDSNLELVKKVLEAVDNEDISELVLPNQINNIAFQSFSTMILKIVHAEKSIAIENSIVIAKLVIADFCKNADLESLVLFKKELESAIDRIPDIQDNNAVKDIFADLDQQIAEKELQNFDDPNSSDKNQFKNKMKGIKLVEPRDFIKLEVAVKATNLELVQKLLKAPYEADEEDEDDFQDLLAVAIGNILDTENKNKTDYKSVNEIADLVVKDYCEYHHGIADKVQIATELNRILVRYKDANNGQDHPNKEGVENLIKIVRNEIELDQQNDADSFSKTYK